MQILPSTDFAFDQELTEIFDVEESESDEKESEKEEKDEKKFASDILNELIRSKSLRNSHLGIDHGIPTPPCIETLSPPPDLA